MYRIIFNRVKRLIPKISQTELIALQSGTTSVDREIYQGVVNTKKLPTFNSDSSQITQLQSGVDRLLERYGSNEVYPDPPNQEHISTLLQDVADSRLFSLIIPEQYGGYPMATTQLSRLLVTLTSANPSLGVTVMVPNSLGPGELLESYGTQHQKQQYLPGLADGSYIPCFGLTGPNNGSDATGQIDKGIVSKNKNGDRVITVTLDKRYITLAPVANLVGIAFNLTDPDGLLSSGGSPGVTLALLPKDHPGLKQHRYHNPLNVGFPNGTLEGTVTFSVDNIIGGESNAGQGWKMLTECLAAGRAVSLPATALAASKVATYGIYQYSRHRKQFNRPILEMEAVSNKLVEMAFHTWLITCSTSLTNHLLDRGDRPSVISALMKYQTTERAREVINHGMDIHGGSAICLGDGNFLEKFYRSAPIGITVEGSNTLTRSLIVFGQGLNKSHPYIYKILESIQLDNLDDFKTFFNKQVGFLLKLYTKSLFSVRKNASSSNYLKRLGGQTVDFALLANFVSLQGGRIKSNQSLSSDMADFFSNLYLAYSVEWYQNSNNVSETLTKYCINRLLDENVVIINRVISNNTLYRYALWHLKTPPRNTSYMDKREVSRVLKDNNKIWEALKKDLHLDSVLTTLEKLETTPADDPEYNDLVDSIIRVGSYPVPDPKVL